MVVVDLHLADVRDLRADLDAVAKVRGPEIGGGVADFDGVVAGVAQRDDRFGLDGFVHLAVARAAAGHYVGGDFLAVAGEQPHDGVE